MAKQLLVLAGPDEGRVLDISPADGLLLGRSRATDSRLIDPHVSRVHCQVQLDGDRAVLHDFDSAAGTFVNGKKVSKHPLMPGDIIRIGNTRLQYVDDLSGQPAAPPPERKPREVKLPPPADWPKQLVGQKVSHYKVESVLARGQFGYVFHGRDTKRNRPAALKVLDPALTKDEKLVQRFVQAMKAAGPLRHPNLLTVYGAGKTGDFCWIATEYVEGESLAAVIGRIEAAGMLDWRAVLRFAVYLTRALEYAHKKKITHRHITPQNILLGKTPKDTKLADLLLDSILEDARRLPRPDAEPPPDSSYFPPEALQPGPLDARSDLYSLGATLYAMLTGRPPFEADTFHELIDKIRNQDPVPPRTLHLAIPEYFQAIVLRLLAKQPAERFQSAQELLAALVPYAQGQGVTV